MGNYRDKKKNINIEKSYGEQYGLVNGRSLLLKALANTLSSTSQLGQLVKMA